MGNVLKMAKQHIIQGYSELGWSNRAIHRATGIHRDTISAYRRRFQNGPKVFTGSEPTEIQNRPKVPTGHESLPRTNSKNIFAHRQIIKEFYEAGLSARRIYQDLVEERGYHGSYETVKRYVRKLRKKIIRFFERLPVAPGKEAQIDFGKARCWIQRNGKRQRPWVFKATLSFSKHAYAELVWRQDIETFLRCLQHAFECFGGVPETIKLDNLKSGVLLACLYEPQIHPLFLSFTKHYGCVPNPCAPRKPEHKGRVERDIRYTNDNALKGREFSSLEEGNLFLKHWNKRWASNRIHGNTKQQVWKLFVAGEKPHLKTLPQSSFTFFRVSDRRVDVHGHVEVGGCFYSVPHQYISQNVTVHYNNHWIRVFDGFQLLVQHRPLSRKGSWVTVPGHKPSYAPIDREQAEGWQCAKAKQIGPYCHRLVYKILCSDHPLAIRKTRGILALAKKYEPAVVEQSCECALGAGLMQYRAVANLCKQSVAAGPENPNPLTQQHELIRRIDFYQNVFEERSCS